MLQVVDDVRARLFTSSEVVAVSGATYRQVDYWVRRGRLKPVRAAQGSGTQRQFDFAGLVQAVLLRMWMRRGWPTDWVTQPVGQEWVAPGLEVEVRIDRALFEAHVESLVKEKLG